MTTRRTFDLLAGVRRLLVLGAHADDAEIGCGATVLSAVAARPDLEVTWVVFSATGERRVEAELSARAFTEGAARLDLVLHAFRDGFFPAEWAAVKEAFEALAPSRPDLVLTHRSDDAHQDHRVVGELTWNTFREHAVLEYEVPKYDGDLGRPGFFVDIDRATAERKLHLLETCFGSQRSRRWFDRRTFEAMLRLRGVECHAPDGYAEAFVARKVFARAGSSSR